MTELETLLFDRVILDFDVNKLSTKLQANILMYSQKDNYYIHLPLVFNKRGYYAPNTFIVQDDQYYIEGQTVLDVRSLTILHQGKIIEKIEYK